MMHSPGSLLPVCSHRVTMRRQLVWAAQLVPYLARCLIQMQNSHYSVVRLTKPLIGVCTIARTSP